MMIKRDRVSDIYQSYDILAKKVRDHDSPPFDRVKHKDQTRSKIAVGFTIGFFSLLVVTLLGIPIYNVFVEAEKVLSLKDTLVTIASIVGTPYGFVVGYYFKGKDES